jgi:hypothetical protein
MISPARLARHPDIKAHVLSGRGAVELWSGHLDEAARVLESAVAAAAPGAEDVRAGCLGHLALVEALRGRMCHAATAAAQAAAALEAGEPQPPVRHPIPAALVASAWVHLEHYELSQARSRLAQADAALTGTRTGTASESTRLIIMSSALIGPGCAGHNNWPTFDTHRVPRARTTTPGADRSQPTTSAAMPASSLWPPAHPGGGMPSACAEPTVRACLRSENHQVPVTSRQRSPGVSRWDAGRKG